MSREQYVLNVIAEECAETAQRAIKAVRFGLGDTQPGQFLDNKRRLEEELGGILGTCDMLGIEPCPKKRAAKPARVTHYMIRSRERGLVE